MDERAMSTPEPTVSEFRAVPLSLAASGCRYSIEWINGKFALLRCANEPSK